jgi:hypothetical protein
VRAEGWRFDLSGKKQEMFTVSTLVPASRFVLEVENIYNENCQISVLNNDNEALNGISLPQGKKKIFIKDPLYKEFGNRYFYRIFIELTPYSIPVGKLYFQIYPER